MAADPNALTAEILEKLMEDLKRQAFYPTQVLDRSNKPAAIREEAKAAAAEAAVRRPTTAHEIVTATQAAFHDGVTAVRKVYNDVAAQRLAALAAQQINMLPTSHYKSYSIKDPYYTMSDAQAHCVTGTPIDDVASGTLHRTQDHKHAFDINVQELLPVVEGAIIELLQRNFRTDYAVDPTYMPLNDVGRLIVGLVKERTQCEVASKSTCEMIYEDATENDPILKIHYGGKAVTLQFRPLPDMTPCELYRAMQLLNKDVAHGEQMKFIVDHNLARHFHEVNRKLRSYSEGS